jgi:peroxiredoxin
LRDHEPDVTAAGATIAAIGTGDIRYAEAFAAEHDIGFPLLVDDDLVTYRAAGARRTSVLGLGSPRVLRAGAKALAAGHRQGRLGPATLLLGATHVVRSDGAVALAWRNADYADNAPVERILRSLVE